MTDNYNMASKTRTKQFAVASVYLLTVLVMLYFSGGDTGDRFAAGHKDINCSKCHTFVAQTSTQYDGELITNKDCLDCHDLNKNMYNSLPLKFHQNSNRNCTDCHSFHNNEAIKAGKKTFLFNYENQNLRTLCLSCHNVNGNLSQISEGHREASKVYHSDFIYLAKLSPSESCMICHSNSSNYTDKALVNKNIPKLNNHSSHPMGIPVVLGKGNSRNRIKTQLDPRIVLLNNKIECQTCHSLTSGNSYQIVQFDNQYDICLGCHEHSSDLSFN